MNANAAAVTKVLKRYNFAKESFTTQQMSSMAWVALEDSIAYNSNLFSRVIEVLETNGYLVEVSGRKALKVTKAGA